jgi:hypothetical protein
VVLPSGCGFSFKEKNREVCILRTVEYIVFKWPIDQESAVGHALGMLPMSSTVSAEDLILMLCNSVRARHSCVRQLKYLGTPGPQL